MGLDPTSDGSFTYHRSPGGYLLSQESGNSALMAGLDRHGDLAFLFDHRGSLSDTAMFDPFGDPLATTGNTAPTLGFQADFTDPASGHVWMGARWYDGGWAAFLSRDSVFGELRTPVSLNRYTYGFANPLSFWDPDGRMPVFDGPSIDGVCGTVSGCQGQSGPAVSDGSAHTAAAGSTNTTFDFVEELEPSGSGSSGSSALVDITFEIRVMSGGEIYLGEYNTDGSFTTNWTLQLAYAAGVLQRVEGDPSLSHESQLATQRYWQACVQAGHTEEQCGIPNDVESMYIALAVIGVSAVTGGVAGWATSAAFAAWGFSGTAATMTIGGVSGVAADQAGRVAYNVFTGEEWHQGLGNPGEIAAAFALGALPGGIAALRSARNPITSIDDALRATDGTAGSIRGVNPTGSGTNCVNCVVATDATLSGYPASALPSGAKPISVLEDVFGGTFKPVTGRAEIEALLTDAGAGARGVVFGSRGSEVGHVFNAVNQGGTVRFLDGQIGGAASFDGFDGFLFMLVPGS